MFVHFVGREEKYCIFVKC